MASTNKCLAQSNKSGTWGKATKKRIGQLCAMTLQEAKSIARHLGLTLRLVRSGAYQVNFRDGNETTAYYTDSLEDAVKNAVEMARTRLSCRPSTRPSVVRGRNKDGRRYRVVRVDHFEGSRLVED
jgi:hypothetical protein